jgi:uncharacterized protein (TIGR02217 family)
MSNENFPVLPGIAWSINKKPMFATKVSEHVSGREVRVSNYAYPLWEWELKYEFLRDSTAYPELQTLMGFFMARRGSWDTFLYVDPSEANTVTLQNLGTGNASNKNFYCTKTYGGFTEPVGYVDPTTLHVFFDVSGVVTEQMTGWTLNPLQQIVFTTAPPIGTIVKATYTWKYRVRFDEDINSFENFMFALWTLKKTVLKSVRPV